MADLLGGFIIVTVALISRSIIKPVNGIMDVVKVLAVEGSRHRSFRG